MDQDGDLHFGFFPDFHDPTILFWGSSSGLIRFAAFLKELGSGKETEKFLNDLPWMASTRDTRVWVGVGDIGSGMTQKKDRSKFDFHWVLTRDTAILFATLVEVVAGSDSPGHHYLESCPSEKCVVVVSKGEYEGLGKI